MLTVARRFAAIVFGTMNAPRVSWGALCKQYLRPGANERLASERVGEYCSDLVGVRSAER